MFEPRDIENQIGEEDLRFQLKTEVILTDVIDIATSNFTFKEKFEKINNLFLIFRRCKFCDGSGYNIVPEHGCGGDENICQSMCPVPAQIECEYCKGNGFLK
jgi:hypothetical protein